MINGLGMILLFDQPQKKGCRELIPIAEYHVESNSQRTFKPCRKLFARAVEIRMQSALRAGRSPPWARPRPRRKRALRRGRRIDRRMISAPRASDVALQ